MISAVGTSQNYAKQLLRERKAEIVERVKSGEIQPSVTIGGRAFTDASWKKLMERVDANIEAVKEEQKKRFERMDKEKTEKAILKKLEEEKSNVPYFYLAKDGVIEYNGVVFICDEEHHALCLGDMTNSDKVINIPLTEGGCLKVNRDNLPELSKAITMFSPSDIRRIMETIARDAKCRQMKLELDEDSNSIGESAEEKMNGSGEDTLTKEQIALLFKDREEDENVRR